MVSNTFSILDYLVLVFLLVMSSLIGVYFWLTSRNNSSNEEFLTGNRQLGLLPVTMSLVASFMSTSTLLGLPAEVFQVGTQFSVQIFSITVAVIVAAEVFMPIYYKLELLSVNEVCLLSVQITGLIDCFSTWPNVFNRNPFEWLARLAFY